MRTRSSQPRDSNQNHRYNEKSNKSSTSHMQLSR
jgi:hypothetical protein